ncbi:MAG: DUF3613 domain-containing protein [Gammaproteobacteria bacterium]
MRNRLILPLTVVIILNVATASAQDQDTIFIQSEQIVPYQATATDLNHEVHAAPILADPAFELNAENSLPQQTSEEPTYDAKMPHEAEAMPIDRIEAGSETEVWLKLQTSGKLAGTIYATPGQTANQIFHRYLRSFTHPIPDQFPHERSTGSSGSR